MSFFSRLTAVVLCAALIGPLTPVEARTRKGDKAITQGRALEAKKDWDAAVEAYEKALAEDPSDIQYRMAVQKARFQAGQMHLQNGLKLRNEGQLGEALLEFQRAFAADPSSVVVIQEVRTTQEMIERERQRVLQTGKESSPEERAETPYQQLKKESEEKLDRMLPLPELKPLGSGRIDLKMNSVSPRIMYETVAAQAGINVIWDSDQAAQPSATPRNITLQNTTLEEALDTLAVQTKTFWKAISSNTIFVTKDDPNTRRNNASHVMRVFYLSNVQAQGEIQEMVNAIRAATDIQRMFPFLGQNAIVARGEADQIAIVEKIIADLDRPKSEVVVDIVVMEVSSTYSRQLATAIASTGLNIPINFTPRSSLRIVDDKGGDDDKPTTTAATNAVALSNIGKITEADWSTTLPSALLQAVMSDANVKVLQSPQIRSVDNGKAQLRIGDKVPTATGSFTPGVGGVGAGVNALVSTQFNFTDVGVNLDLTPRVHDNGDVSLNVQLEVSNVNGYKDIGGIEQPLIGQKRMTQDIRLREGEFSLLGGLMKQQETKSVIGVPGLSSIPLLRRLFTEETVERQRGDLLIALVPHVIRRPEFKARNLRAIDIGTQTNTKLNYAPKPSTAVPAEGSPAPAPTPAPEAAAPTPSVVAPGQSVVAPGGQNLISPPTAPPATAPPATAPPATAPPATAPQSQAAAPAAPGAPAARASARFQQAKIEVPVSGAFTTTLLLDSGSDVASASPMQITFDPKLLSLTDATPGDLFSRDGQQPVFVRNIMNDMGLATVQFSRGPGGAPVSAPGTLVTLRFQAVGRGSTTINAGVTIRNSQGLLVGSSSPQMAVEIK